MMEYIDELKEKDLLKEYNGKTLLDELLEQDKDLTLNKVLSSRVKSNINVAIILKSKDIEQKNILLQSNLSFLNLKSQQTKKQQKKSPKLSTTLQKIYKKY